MFTMSSLYFSAANISTPQPIHYQGHNSLEKFTLFSLPSRALQRIAYFADQCTANNLAFTAKHFFFAIHAQNEEDAAKQRRIHLIVPMPRMLHQSKFICYSWYSILSSLKE